MAKVPETEVSNQEKVYNLYLELIESEKEKKEAMKVHRENISRIKDEIRDLIEAAQEVIVRAQRDS